jgi:hypothetical protein
MQEAPQERKEWSECDIGDWIKVESVDWDPSRESISQPKPGKVFRNVFHGRENTEGHPLWEFARRSMPVLNQDDQTIWVRTR